MHLLTQLPEEEKHQAKARKEEEKAAKAAEKVQAKNDKDAHKSVDGPSDEATERTPEETTPHKHRLHTPFTPRIQTKTNVPRGDSPIVSPESSPESATNSPSSRVKNWLKSRLQKPRAKSVSVGQKSDKQSGGGFIGGHALTSRHADGTGSMTSLSETAMRSMREVALAGRPLSAMPLRTGEEPSAIGPAESLSSVSSDDNNDNAGSVTGEREARSRTKAARPEPLDGLTPPKVLADPARVPSRGSGSPSRDSKFIEIIE